MAGGDAAVLEEVRLILQTLGKTIAWCGPNGAGQIVKACNQTLVAVIIAGVAEALVLRVKACVDPARCGVLEDRGQRMIDGDFKPGFRIRLHAKDLAIVDQAARYYGVPMFVTVAATQLSTAALAAGHGELDHTGLLMVIEDLGE